ALELIERCAGEGPRIICLPELFSTAYFAVAEAVESFDLAETVPGPTTNTLAGIARKYNTCISGSIFEHDELERLYYNCAFLIAADGTLAGKYRKVHIPYVNHGGKYLNEKYYFRPGDLGFPVFPADGIKTGLLICYDRSFAEAWRCLSLKGAEIVMVPTASSGWRSDSWEFGLRTKAIENSLFIIAPNRVGEENFYRHNSPAFFGSSLIVSPLGNVLAKATATDEEIITAELDFADMHEARQRYRFLHDWRPEAYDAYAGVYSRITGKVTPIPDLRDTTTPEK
ncbi:MAG: nitrilase-related carbon-nitrogen hydrolase, partial [Dehalococcoidales bacterium]|nr:nitrilase-related carbon-nitrogen hydrolase [Dehalococcoidales bacterium]